MKTQRRTGLIADDLSTHAAFQGPLVPVGAGADILRFNPVLGTIVLRPKWSATGVRVSLPLRVWNARNVMLSGLADARAVDAALGRRALRVNDNLLPDARGTRALVQIYGVDYGGTSLGPLKAVFTMVLVEGKLKFPVLYYRWWRYFGNSILNKEFKETVWGVRPNHLAGIETDFTGKRQAVTLVENGRTALRMIFNLARFPDVETSGHYLPFKSVAGARSDGGENDVELGALALKRGDVDTLDFPFDGREDEFFLDPASTLAKDLNGVDFVAKSWGCLLNYGGVVKIYDAYGGGTLRQQTGSATRNGARAHNGSRATAKKR